MTGRRQRQAPAAGGARRPMPPPGFVHFRWKTRQVGPPGDRHTVELCPACGDNGTCWDGGGFTDPEAQRLADSPKAQRLRGAGDASVSYEGVPILLHWSRYGTGTCMTCGCEYWHDFVGERLPGKRSGGWAYYWRAAAEANGQLRLFARGLDLS